MSIQCSSNIRVRVSLYYRPSPSFYACFNITTLFPHRIIFLILSCLLLGSVSPTRRSHQNTHKLLTGWQCLQATHVDDILMSLHCHSLLFTQVVGGVNIYPCENRLLLTVASDYNLSFGLTYVALGIAADANCFLSAPVASERSSSAKSCLNVTSWRQK